MKSGGGAKKKPAAASSAERVQQHRAILRARGMRLVSRWVPDTRRPEFIRKYHAQLAALAANPEGAAFWKWMDQVRSTEGWI